MATQHQAYISLDTCINQYLDQAELGIEKYYKCWNLAVRCTEQLGLDFFYQVQSVKLPINANYTVNLPANYINYTKIGVLNSKGEIVPLSFNNKLTTYADLQPTRLQQTQDNTFFSGICFTNPVWYNYWLDGTFENLYGLPSGAPFVGSFKIDNQNGIILLNETFQFPYIMLEYIASPVQGQEIYVPIQFKEAIIAYLAWKNAKIGAGRYAWRIEGNYQKEYYNERRLAVARFKPFYIQEAYEADQIQNRLTIKV